jgi:predicted ATP-binding protein involved in virulence
MSFKIIALEVLKGCSKIHSKNLQFKVPYLFYKNYSFIPKQSSDEYEIYHKPVLSETIYNLNDQNLDINISAIVGKNGTGKSTIVELLMKGVNNLFYKYKSLHNEKKFHKINRVPGDIEINLYYQYKDNSIYKLYIKNTEFEISLFNKQARKTNTDENVFLFDRLITQEEFNLNDFFYTEVINYSLYAYNSKVDGPWIKNIFHKNDAYQTPIVLNPFRKEGIIDVNSENDLIFQRLLSNILRKDEKPDQFRNLGDNLKANEIVVSKKLKPIKESVYYENFKNYNIIDEVKINESNTYFLAEKLIDSFIGKEAINKDISTIVVQHSKAYITYKTLSIVTKYNEYKKYFNPLEKSLYDKKIKNLIKQLIKDDSHITFKLKQTLNYLKHNHIKYNPNKNENIPISDLSNNIDTLKNPESGIMMLLPAPIFTIDLKLITIKGKYEEVIFNSLSSGEKQLIYSINSLFYHLINLYSVSNSSDEEKIIYDKISIILEEIELYFHPDFQRKYINLLIEGLKRLELKNLSLNFIFVTHSPFILSDIPSTNIMYLNVIENESSQIMKNKKSFGANIHELLGDNFFFNNDEIYIGEYAKNKIDKTIEWLNDLKDKNLKIRELNNIEKLNSIQIAKKKQITESIKKLSTFSKDHLELIKIIDEPIIKNKLLEMYSEIFSNNQRIEYLIKEKNRIEEEIKNLRSEKTNQSKL